jgi:alpha/beta superfamily hydrolase
MKEIAHRAFIAGDGLDIHELTGKGDSVHARQDTLVGVMREVLCVLRVLRGWFLLNHGGRRGHGGVPLGCYAELSPMDTQASTIRSLFLDGPAGRLEALLNAGTADATYAAVVCHPHPLYGGTLHNKVVFHAMKALNGFGFPVLRFNFRGTGLSHGEHGHGSGEVDDVRAALDWVDREFRLPLIFSGFSFGAAVGLRAACPDARVKAAIGLGLPVSPIDDRTYDFGFLASCLKPKLFVSGDRDQFGTPAQLEALVQTVADPKKLILIAGGDHFFEGRLRELREAIERWIGDAVIP